MTRKIILNSMRFLAALGVVLLTPFSIQASEWVNLFSNDSFGNHVSIDFNFQKSELKFTFDKPKVANKKEVYLFPANNPENVAKIISQISLDMKNKWSLRAGIQESVLTKIEEVKYLNPKSHKLIHFNTNGRAPASTMPSYARSVPVFSIRLETTGNLFQMRAVLDEVSEIVKYSLVSEDRDMSTFDIIKRADFIAIAERESGQVLFFFRIIDYGTEEKDVIFYNRLDGIHLEDYSRERYSLRKREAEWTVQRYSESDHDFVDFSEEVVLTNKSVDHEPVVRVEGSDKYFPSFSENEISKLLENILKINNNQRAVILFQNEYHNCMIENFQTNLVNGRNPNQDDLIEACKKVGILHVDHLTLIESSMKSLKDKDMQENQIKAAMTGVHLEYLSCLVEKRIMVKSDFHSEIRIEKLMSPEVKTNFLQIALDCKESGVARTHVEEINRSQMAEVSIAHGEIPKRDFIQESRQITEESYKKCRKVVGRRFSDFCKDYSDMVKSTVIFEQAHLSLLGVNGLRVFRKCNLDVQRAALDLFKKGNSHEKILAQSNKRQVQCAANALKSRIEGEGISGIEAFLSKIHFIKSLGIRVSSSILNEIKSSVLQCLGEKSIESLSLSDLVARHDQNLDYCRVSGIKEQIPTLYKFLANIRSSKYTDDKEIIEYLEGRLSRNIKRQIQDLNTIDEINSVISKDSIFSFAMIISKVVISDMNSTFDFNSEINLELHKFKLDSFESLEKKINILIGNNDGRSMRSGLLEYFKKGHENNGEWGVEIFF